MNELALAPLTATEVERGWVTYVCDTHGGLVAMEPGVHVVCRCGKRAREERNGRIIDPKTNRPTAARSHVAAHTCSDCGATFGGTSTQRQHRVGRGAKRRCMTSDEMIAKGWHVNARGGWSREVPTPDAGRARLGARAASKGRGGSRVTSTC